MSMFGGGFGGFGSAGRPAMGAAGRKGNGLAFAGVPDDLAEAVAALEAREGETTAPHVDYDPVRDTGGEITLGRLLTRRRGLLAAVVVAVLVETVLLQSGPYLVQVGIDRQVRSEEHTSELQSH